MPVCVADDCHFNPRSREGSDAGLIKINCTSSISIHAPAKGATCAKSSRFSTVICISIHAPAKGATFGFHNQAARSHISIHAPAKGATGAESKQRGEIAISIHAPAKGATMCSRT